MKMTMPRASSESATPLGIEKSSERKSDSGCERWCSRVVVARGIRRTRVQLANTSLPLDTLSDTLRAPEVLQMHTLCL